MTIRYILNNVLSGKMMKYHCADLNSKAMIAFNVACPIGIPFSQSIVDVKTIDIKEIGILKERLINHSPCDKQNVSKLACLIYSNKEEELENILTVKDVVKKLNQLDGDLILCCMKYNYNVVYDSIAEIINILDATNNKECKRLFVPKNYDGTMTNFII